MRPAKFREASRSLLGKHCVRRTICVGVVCAELHGPYGKRRQFNVGRAPSQEIIPDLKTSLDLWRKELRINRLLLEYRLDVGWFVSRFWPCEAC
ncbi:hypothetical protein D3C85_1482590 [compost metagenome]